MTRTDCYGINGNQLTTVLEHTEKIDIASTAGLAPTATDACIPEWHYEDDRDIFTMTNRAKIIKILQLNLLTLKIVMVGLKVAFGNGCKNYIQRINVS